jgi:hypothetical protein
VSPKPSKSRSPQLEFYASFKQGGAFYAPRTSLELTAAWTAPGFGIWRHETPPAVKGAQSGDVAPRFRLIGPEEGACRTQLMTDPEISAALRRLGDLQMSSIVFDGRFLTARWESFTRGRGYEEMIPPLNQFATGLFRSMASVGPSVTRRASARYQWFLLFWSPMFPLGVVATTVFFLANQPLWEAYQPLQPVPFAMKAMAIGVLPTLATATWLRGLGREFGRSAWKPSILIWILCSLLIGLGLAVSNAVFDRSMAQSTNVPLIGKGERVSRGRYGARSTYYYLQVKLPAHAGGRIFNLSVSDDYYREAEPGHHEIYLKIREGFWRQPWLEEWRLVPSAVRQ